MTNGDDTARFPLSTELLLPPRLQETAESDLDGLGDQAGFMESPGNLLLVLNNVRADGFNPVFRPPDGDIDRLQVHPDLFGEQFGGLIGVLVKPFG